MKRSCRRVAGSTRTVAAPGQDRTDADLAHVQRLHEAVVGSSPVGHTLQAAIPVDIHLADGSAQ